MELLSIEPKDIHFVLSFPASELKLLKDSLDLCTIAETGKPEDKIAADYLVTFDAELKKLLDEMEKANA